MKTGRKIVVTTTAYEGPDFPEAGSYPEYVEEQLAERFPGVEIDVSVGSSISATLYGFRPAGDRYLERDIEDLIRVGLWDDFCTDGYRVYSTVATFEGSAPCRS